LPTDLTCFFHWPIRISALRSFLTICAREYISLFRTFFFV
jgi:hypothetical protein